LKNTGKIFEDDFKASVPRDVYYLRLHDSSIGFDIAHSTQRFSLKSPYDAVLCKNGKMYALELKSHKGKSMSFGDKKDKVIKMRQVENLLAAKEVGGAVAGLILNFSDYEETYFIDARKFYDFTQTCGKKSINLDNVREFGIKIPCEKKKTHYRYDLNPILKNS